MLLIQQLNICNNEMAIIICNCIINYKKTPIKNCIIISPCIRILIIKVYTFYCLFIKLQTELNIIIILKFLLISINLKTCPNTRRYINQMIFQPLGVCHICSFTFFIWRHFVHQCPDWASLYTI